MKNMLFLIKVLLLVMPWENSARIVSKAKHPRLSVAEPTNSFYFNRIDTNTGAYGFGYDVSDPTSGDTQFRNEERYPNGTVVGSYGYLDSNGKPHRYRYIADHKGYRVMRERPFALAAPPMVILSNAQPNDQLNNEINWTKKKTNDALKSTYNRREEVKNKTFMQYPLKYFHH